MRYSAVWVSTTLSLYASSLNVGGSWEAPASPMVNADAIKAIFINPANLKSVIKYDDSVAFNSRIAVTQGTYTFLEALNGA